MSDLTNALVEETPLLFSTKRNIEKLSSAFEDYQTYIRPETRHILDALVRENLDDEIGEALKVILDIIEESKTEKVAALAHYKEVEKSEDRFYQDMASGLTFVRNVGHPVILGNILKESGDGELEAAFAELSQADKERIKRVLDT